MSTVETETKFGCLGCVATWSENYVLTHGGLGTVQKAHQYWMPQDLKKFHTLAQVAMGLSLEDEVKILRDALQVIREATFGMTYRQASELSRKITADALAATARGRT